MKKVIYAFLIFSLAILTQAPGLYAEEDFVEVESQAEEEDSDPSAFEGDSDSMPGERAPENMPMDDAPGVVGVGIE